MGSSGGKRCGDFGHKTNAGKPCGAWPIPGTQACKRHAGVTITQAKAKGRLRLTAAAWSLDGLPSNLDATAEAIRLILVTKSMHADLLKGLQSEVMDKDLAGLVGVAYGESGKTGEYITGLTQLEGIERDRLWRFLKDYRQAGYDERRLEIAEQQIDVLDMLLRAVLTRLGHDLTDPRVIDAVTGEMARLPELTR